MRKNFRVHQYLHTFLCRKNGTPNSYFYIGVVEGFSVTSCSAPSAAQWPLPLAVAHVHGLLPCSPAHEKRCIRFARHRSVCAAASHPCRRCDAVVPLPRDSGLLEILPPRAAAPPAPLLLRRVLPVLDATSPPPADHHALAASVLAVPGVGSHPLCCPTVASAHVCGMGAEPAQEAGERTHAV